MGRRSSGAVDDGTSAGEERREELRGGARYYTIGIRRVVRLSTVTKGITLKGEESP